jgi:hypothetical protein
MMNEKLTELLKNEEFCIAFFDALEDIPTLKSLLERSGISATDEEIRQLVAIAKQQIAKADGAELSEDDLDDVSGGIIGWVIAGTVSGIFFGYQVYKARKGVNSWYC